MRSEQFKHQVLVWNLKFPLDRDYRQKYGIAFGSEEHKKTNQVDIYFEFLEEKIYKGAYEEAKKQIEMEKAFEKGQWLKEPVFDTEESLALFNKMDISSIKIEDE